MASALTHCQKERGLSQWLACVHEEEEEEEDEDEEAAAAVVYEDEEEDEDEEETITIEEVCPPGRRRCFPIFFSRRCFFGPPLLSPCSTLLIFLPIFCPFVSDQAS